MQNKRIAVWAGLGVAALMALVQPAMAKKPGAAGGRKQGNHLVKKLGLTPTQAAQIQAIHRDGKQQLQAVKADKTLSRKDRRARVQAIRATTKQKVDDVLTADQKTQMDALRAQHKQRRENRKKAA